LARYALSWFLDDGAGLAQSSRGGKWLTKGAFAS
jgi:hypothetical protein